MRRELALFLAVGCFTRLGVLLEGRMAMGPEVCSFVVKWPCTIPLLRLGAYRNAMTLYQERCSWLSFP